jgi:hypothetical protein
VVLQVADYPDQTLVTYSPATPPDPGSPATPPDPGSPATPPDPGR